MAPERGATRCVWPRTLRVTAGKVLALVLVTACAVAGSVPQAGAQSEPPTEYQIKAAFLYNFSATCWTRSCWVRPSTGGD